MRLKAYLMGWFEALKRTDQHWLRHTIGVLLVIGGLLGFLPVLGYWMLPLGLALLAVDFPVARRLYRRMSVWWGRRRQQWRRFTGTAPSPVGVRNAKGSKTAGGGNDP
jgi:purine-cytosine permease-like protein